MKIGIGIPCHERDVGIVQRCLASIDEMEPGPDEVYVCINDGSKGLRIRRDILDHLFYDLECDVVVNVSADFAPMKGMLKHVARDKVTSFGFLRKHPTDLLFIIKRLLTRRAWSGCYAIPKEIWNRFRETDWDGMDSSLDWWCRDHRLSVKRVKRPQYWVLRFSERMIEAALQLPTFRQRLTRLMTAW